ncbi:hypothetical protein C8R43DRAFT_1120708 [Mycena crocata]|nr:hypothetical protein C8R43DRAFT_1120708 [Mycena crocata]
MGRQHSSLSQSHKVSYASGPLAASKSKTVTLNQTGTQIQAKKEKYKQQLTALSHVQREELFSKGQYDIDMPDAPDYYPLDGWQDVDSDSDEERTFNTLPPGEEGTSHSHAGKELVFQQIFEKCKPGRGDPRRRALRVQTLVDSWKEQMPLLVDTYLELKKNGPISSDSNLAAWTIDTWGFEEHSPHRFIHTNTTQRTNETLIRHGYIGASPEKVTLAFPIRLFEIFQQIHRVCPRYSFDTLSMHHVPYKSTLAEQLSDGYDAYLEVVRHVDARAHAALGRDASWYAQNVCPPCLYKVKEEPPLKFSFLACMDGNNSLKLVDSTFRSGQCSPGQPGVYIVPLADSRQVDLFKDEVANSQKEARSKKKKNTASTTAPSASSPSTLPVPSPLLEPDIEVPAISPGDSSQPASVPPTDGSASLDAADDDVAWLNINELSGNEAAELEKCIDTSGELMKYPLGLIKWLLNTYGEDIGLGYDIMCAFFKTLTRSSLGAKVTAMRLRSVVPAFHGHAHNRACQIGWHPLYVDGVGMEDFEECERTFSKSNHLASSTQLATSFHRQQQIDEHFTFYDRDKHALSGNFIYQNYRQTLEKLTINRAQLSVLETQLGTTAADYERDHATEVKYFNDLRSEPDVVQQTTDYMDWLLKLHVSQQNSAAAKLEFSLLDHNILLNGYTRPQIAARKYWVALTELERLVVQRLFELTKMGMSGLAYKLREKISKALRTRADAIRRALQAYNEAAAMLNPLRQQLSFAQIINTTSLAEFDLLRDTRQDIRTQPWTQPSRRTTVPNTPPLPQFLRCSAYLPPSFIADNPASHGSIAHIAQLFIEAVGVPTVQKWSSNANQRGWLLNQTCPGPHPNPVMPTLIPQPHTEGSAHYKFNGRVVGVLDALLGLPPAVPAPPTLPVVVIPDDLMDAVEQAGYAEAESASRLQQIQIMQARIESLEALAENLRGQLGATRSAVYPSQGTPSTPLRPSSSPTCTRRPPAYSSSPSRPSSSRVATSLPTPSPARQEVEAPVDLETYTALRLGKDRPPKQAPIPAEHLKKKKDEHERKQVKMDDTVREWMEATHAKAQELATLFDMSPRYFLDIFFQGGVHMIHHQEKINPYNAFKAEKAAENREVGIVKKVPELHEDIIDKYRELTSEQLAELCERHGDLREKNFHLRCDTPRARIQDASNVIRNVKMLITGLANRIGVAGFFCIVRSHADFHMAPKWFFTSPELESYMPMATRKTWDTREVGMKLEVFSIAGSDPANLLRSSKQKADWLKFQICDKMKKMLVDASVDPNTAMSYTWHEEDIVQRYNIVLEGWTTKFVNPSELSTSLPALRKLLDAINNKDCKYMKLTPKLAAERRTQWEEDVSTALVVAKHRKERIDSGVPRKRPHDDDDTGGAENDGGDAENADDVTAPPAKKRARSAMSLSAAKTPGAAKAKKPALKRPRKPACDAGSSLGDVTNKRSEARRIVSKATVTSDDEMDTTLVTPARVLPAPAIPAPPIPAPTVPAPIVPTPSISAPTTQLTEEELAEMDTDPYADEDA